VNLDTIINHLQLIIETILHSCGILAIRSRDIGYKLLCEHNRTGVIQRDTAWIDGARQGGFTRTLTDPNAPMRSSSVCRHPSLHGRSALREPPIELRPRWARLLLARGFQHSNPFSRSQASPSFGSRRPEDLARLSIVQTRTDSHWIQRGRGRRTDPVPPGSLGLDLREATSLGQIVRKWHQRALHP